MKDNEAYLTIAEASQKIGVPAHVLRFWEKSFKELNPMKKIGGRRFYSPKDMTLLEEIKYLLYEKKLTVKGTAQLLGKKEEKADVLEDKRQEDFVKEIGEIKEYVDTILEKMG